MAAPLPSDRVQKVFHEIEERINEDDWGNSALNERIEEISNQVLNKSSLDDYEKSEVRGLIDDRKIHPMQGLDEKINEKPLILHCKGGDVEISRNMSNRFGLIRTVLENDKEATEINVDLDVQVVKDALEILESCEKFVDEGKGIFSNDSDINRKINNYLVVHHYLNGERVTLSIIADFLTDGKTSIDLKDSKLIEIWNNFLNIPEAKVPTKDHFIKKMQVLVWVTVSLYMSENNPDLKEFLKGFEIIPAVYHYYGASFSDFLKSVDFIKREGFSNYSADIDFNKNWIESEPTVPRAHLVKAVIKHEFTAATFKILSEDCPRLSQLAFFYRSEFLSPDLKSDVISIKEFPNLRNLSFVSIDWVTPEILDIILEKCPKLTEIRISDCDNITEEYVASLRKRYPEMKIYYSQ